MKNKKLFELSYALNFIFCFGFIVIATYMNSGSGLEDFYAILFYLCLVFIAVIVPFNWLCYSLLKNYKAGQQLTKSSRVLGSILSFLFSLLTIVLVIGSVDLINNAFNMDFTLNRMAIIAFIFFWGATVTSVYLSISYWVIRKQVNARLKNIILKLGEEIDS